MSFFIPHDFPYSEVLIGTLGCSGGTLVKHLTLGSGSGCDLRVVGSNPMLAPCSVRSLVEILSHSPSDPTAHALSLINRSINVKKKKKNTATLGFFWQILG